MYGAIAGDIIGSIYEIRNMKKTDFKLFKQTSRITDDTVMTIAIADSLTNDIPYKESMLKWGNLYPKVGYGGRFKKWLKGDIKEAYNSFGNGSAMRVSPCGYLENMEQVLEEAKKSALPTHNHPEGIKGAQSVAAAIFLARKGNSKADIKSYIETNFNYDLSPTPDEIRPSYSFDVTCQGSVPESICCFLASSDVENAIRLAVSLGGDADTQAAIAGSIAEAFYQGIPTNIMNEISERIPPEMKVIIEAFLAKHHL